MSMTGFIRYLQELLSMVNIRDDYSVALAKAALTSTVGLAIASKKVDPVTQHAMHRAVGLFEYLVENARDFVGKPGDYQGNEQKRRRLQLMLQPGC